MLSGRSGSCAVLPNPFYQIYEGAVLLRGTAPYYAPCTESTGYLSDFDSVPEEVWRQLRVAVHLLARQSHRRGDAGRTADRLIELADRHDFVIASDECYSEIYPDESSPPVGLLQACASIGRDDYSRCVVFHSLSKRSNLPGLRSGFVAGDAAILDRFFLYRTYHGCAMPAHVQHLSELAWSDEDARRSTIARCTGEKFAVVTPMLAPALGVTHPEGGFYYWPRTPIDDESFTRGCSSRRTSPCLPGRYLSRPAERHRSGHQSGAHGDGGRTPRVHRRRRAHRPFRALAMTAL